jgi:hypothetical protein
VDAAIADATTRAMYVDFTGTSRIERYGGRHRRRRGG